MCRVPEHYDRDGRRAEQYVELFHQLSSDMKGLLDLLWQQRLPHLQPPLEDRNTQQASVPATQALRHPHA
jgi:hypothetical protein